MKKNIDTELKSRKKYNKYEFSFELTRWLDINQRWIAHRVLGRILDSDYWKHIYYNPVSESYKIENNEQMEKRLEK